MNQSDYNAIAKNIELAENVATAATGHELDDPEELAVVSIAHSLAAIAHIMYGEMMEMQA